MIRIMIVDDHGALRAVLRSALASEPDIEVCALAGSGEDALALATSLDPDVVVMDLVMPGMGGVAATRAITDSHRNCRVLVLSWQGSQRHVEAALRAGAAGFVHKSEAPDRLLAAVRTVAGDASGRS